MQVLMPRRLAIGSIWSAFIVLLTCAGNLRQYNSTMLFLLYLCLQLHLRQSYIPPRLRRWRGKSRFELNLSSVL
ncbi:hypothetical protein F5B18DRAFT_609884 [Nemania serpens]|nr:hypothetical protein F5B18DRAFT_609884 [Nemania serpens]